MERQIKYLGLVIEKDEEYVIQEDDIEMLRSKGMRVSMADIEYSQA